MKLLKTLILIIVILFAFTGSVFARSGCCSKHQGVCGCSCCDGTALSATCLPFYPECQSQPPESDKPTQQDTQYIQPVNDTYTLQATSVPVIPTSIPKPTIVKTPTNTPKPKVKNIKRIISKIKSNSPILFTDILKQELSIISKPTPTSKINILEGFYKVSSVVDGDTIRALVNGKVESVRLLGIDTPETKDPRKPVQCFGEAASKKMSEFVSGKIVKLVSDPTQGDRDKYKRLLRYVYLENGTFVNGEMVKQGYAFSYKQYPTQKLDEFNADEKYARENNLGLWGSCPVKK